MAPTGNNGTKPWTNRAERDQFFRRRAANQSANQYAQPNPYWIPQQQPFVSQVTYSFGYGGHGVPPTFGPHHAGQWIPAVPTPFPFYNWSQPVPPGAPQQASPHTWQPSPGPPQQASSHTWQPPPPRQPTPGFIINEDNGIKRPSAPQAPVGRPSTVMKESTLTTAMHPSPELGSKDTTVKLSARIDDVGQLPMSVSWPMDNQPSVERDVDPMPVELPPTHSSGKPSTSYMPPGPSSSSPRPTIKQEAQKVVIDLTLLPDTDEDDSDSDASSGIESEELIVQSYPVVSGPSLAELVKTRMGNHFASRPSHPVVSEPSLAERVQKFITMRHPMEKSKAIEVSTPVKVRSQAQPCRRLIPAQAGERNSPVLEIPDSCEKMMSNADIEKNVLSYPSTGIQHGTSDFRYDDQLSSPSPAGMQRDAFDFRYDEQLSSPSPLRIQRDAFDFRYYDQLSSPSPAGMQYGTSDFRYDDQLSSPLPAGMQLDTSILGDDPPNSNQSRKRFVVLPKDPPHSGKGKSKVIVRSNMAKSIVKRKRNILSHSSSEGDNEKGDSHQTLMPSRKKQSRGKLQEQILRRSSRVRNAPKTYRDIEPQEADIMMNSSQASSGIESARGSTDKGHNGSESSFHPESSDLEDSDPEVIESEVSDSEVTDLRTF